LFQSCKNFNSLFVNECFVSVSRIEDDIVDKCAPAFSASGTCSGLRIEAARTCFSNSWFRLISRVLRIRPMADRADIVQAPEGRG
jgi:hypothetical protein